MLAKAPVEVSFKFGEIRKLTEGSVVGGYDVSFFREISPELPYSLVFSMVGSIAFEVPVGLVLESLLLPD